MALGVKKLFQHLDAQLHELRNTLLHKVAGDPGSPVESQYWYDDTANRVKYRDNAGTKTVAHTGEIVAGATFDNPIASAVGDTMDPGVDTDSSRADHRHAREAFASPAASAIGDSSSAGSGTTVPHANHVHAREAFASPTASAVGDSQGAGSATTVPHSDHVHAREAFAAPVALTAFGVSTATGTATTVVHSDHVHGSPAHDATAHSAITINNLAVPTADVSLNSHKLTSVTDPSSAQDAATKAYVDATAAGVRDPKDSVRAASTANVTIASALENGDAIDGVTLATGDRVLLKDQSTGAENGIYVVVASGAASRSTDADSSAEVTGGLYVWVNEGTANADTGWLLTTNDAITLNTTALTFSQVSGLGQVTAGGGVGKSGNTLSVAAGFGITQETDGVAVTKTLVPIFKTGLVGGAGPATQYTITNPGFAADTHVSVVVTEESSGEQVEVGIQVESDGDLVVDFGIVSVAGTAYRYMATGLAA